MWKNIGIGFAVLVVLSAIFGGDGEESGGESKATATGSSGGKSEKENYIGEWVQGRYFKVAVLDVTERKSAPVEFMCESAPNGSRYVMVNIALENTDSESRTIMTEGELQVKYEGKSIEYDQTESCTLGQEGFLNFMDDLGPFVRKDGRITFVVPDRFNVSDMVYITPRDELKVKLTSRPEPEAAEAS